MNPMKKLQYSILSLGSGSLAARLGALIVFLVPLIGTSASTLNDIRPGMTVEDAAIVAIRCIQAASRMKVKDVRLQDTLAFVGINDEMRLDALKRHLMRNPRIGVRSVKGKAPLDEYQYLILSSHLASVETKWTVAKLVQTISEKAGIALLTYGRSAAIVVECHPAGAEKPNTAVPRDDPNFAVNGFVTCIAGDRGVRSAGVSSATGRDYRYELDQRDQDKLANEIAQGLDYKGVIEFIASKACARQKNSAVCFK